MSRHNPGLVDKQEGTGKGEGAPPQTLHRLRNEVGEEY
jgi:hypothetical protein